ncbi:uncharacterized protein LOC111274687 [Durio zibethinus]|uniref:Uncharacterized protein LOC111274687 n=1 Tax=Durio zibethinus TaxID=66656 RepID=A0A6P5WIM4_DURZI|nr:uncharacterized protein LOC111274687 [Durio zibethinus]
MLNRAHETGGNAKALNVFWRKLWKLDIPAKVKVFGWRLNHGILPVLCNLRKRGIDIQDCFLRSRQEGQSVMHVIKRCSEADEIWRMVQCGDEWICNELDSETGWLSKVAELVDKNSLELGIMTSWMIWHNRNIEIKTRETRKAEDMVAFIRRYLEEYKDAQTHPSSNLKQVKHSWTTPENGFVNANFDGTLRTEEGICGIGVVIQDATGKVRGACMTIMRNAGDLTIA